MMEGSTPCLASDVAPPALIDWPLTELSKNKAKREVKKDLVGTSPASVIHRREERGKR